MNRHANPRTTNAIHSSAAYRANGRKPTIDDATALEIKRKADAGASQAELGRQYCVTPHTIRLAIQRATFARGGGA